MERIFRRLVVPVLLLALAAAAGAEEPAARRAALFPLAALGDAPAEPAAPYGDIMRTALRLRLEQAGIEAVEVDPSAFRTEDEAVRKADFAVRGFYLEQGHLVYYGLTAHGVRDGSLAAVLFSGGPGGLLAFNLAQELAEELAERISGSGRGDLSFAPARPAGGEPRRLIFESGQEGLGLYLANGALLGRVVDGRLAVEGLAPGDEILVEARLAGHYPAVLAVTMPREAESIRIEALPRKTRRDLSLYTTYGQAIGMGAGLRWFAVPDYVFAGFRGYIYVHYGFSRYALPLVHGDLGMTAGGYILFDHHSPFRVYLSAGLGLIATTAAADIPGAADWYLNPLNLGVELNLRPWSVFLELHARFSLATGLLGWEYVMVNGSVPPISLGVRRAW